MANFLVYFTTIAIGLVVMIANSATAISLFDPEFYFELLADPHASRQLAALETNLLDFDSDLSCQQCMDIATQAAKTFDDDDAIAYLKEVVREVCTTTESTQEEIDKCIEDHSNLIDLLALIAKYATTATTKLDWDARTVCSTIIPACEVNCCLDKYLPEQLRLSYTESTDARMLTWTVYSKPAQPIVLYDTEPGQFRYKKHGIVSSYDESMWQGFLVKAPLLNIQSSTRYYYKVGDEETGQFTEVRTFYSGDSEAGKAGRPFRFAQVADMDYTHFSTNTINRISELIDKNQIDLVLHVGDIGYSDGSQAHWDEFFRKIEPLSSRVPYMVAPGNHEFLYNFTTYKARFAMPGDTENMYYSFSPSDSVHFTMLNTETIINTPHIDSRQRHWLKNDLETSNHKWKIVTGHRPFYCTSSQKTRCNLDAAHLRGLTEETFNDNGVDLVLGGHVHSYERSNPVYREKSTSTDYNNPIAPVYVVNGVSGNRESLTLPKNDKEWSNSPFAVNGYSVGIIEGDSLKFTFYKAETNEILDTFTIVKN